jgi:protein-disulfide isomerase
MASRTKQKEEARARRLAEEQARAERTRRQRRMQMIGGVVLAAIVVVVAAIVISSGGAKKETGLQKAGTQQSNATIAGINKLLDGIPQSGAVLGNPKAPVTMTYYGDYECPVCQAFTLQGGFSQLVSNDVRAGKVKVVYRAFCTATCGSPDPGVFDTQQVAGLSAGKQNLFWQYTELFYHEQGTEDSGYVTESYLQGLAKQIPTLNFASWMSGRNDPNLTAQVGSDQASARQLGVSGTPTLIFAGPKGQAAASQAVPTYAQLESVIKQVT